MKQSRRNESTRIPPPQVQIPTFEYVVVYEFGERRPPEVFGPFKEKCHAETFMNSDSLGRMPETFKRCSVTPILRVYMN